MLDPIDSPTSAKSPFDIFLPLMAKVQATGTPETFSWSVSEAYHTVESDLYDQVHVSMFISLDRIWQRLVSCLPAEPAKLRVLDVGAGTGLVGQMFDRLAPSRVETLTCVEPNQAMIVKASQKAKSWAFPVEFVNGVLGAVPPAPTFDVITINSVLHHIVELGPFLQRLSAYLKPGGVFLAAHDPRGDAWSDPIAIQRKESRRFWRFIDPLLVTNTLQSKCSRWLGRQPASVSMEEKVNAILIGEGAIGSPMDIKSIYAVTDIHVPGQPGAMGTGLSTTWMAKHLEGFSLEDSFTYQYFGFDWVHLGVIQRRMEHRLWNRGDAHGFLFASAWRFRSESLPNGGGRRD
ncbi:MAG: hypothetical protein FD165_1163 [Gammaproteobacteria bacterium]|nr:MAG: hypothetical protein FD165_1163 [Gammaproteobacteria bacterium]TND07322.1 MAG: hypothetical protein FD120_60 [Gammaproteobacteria bacterium]